MFTFNRLGPLQLGTGSIGVWPFNEMSPTSGNAVAYISCQYSPNGIREMIIARKGILTAPLQFEHYKFAGLAADGHADPLEAEVDARSSDKLNITRFNSDRWFVSGDAPPANPLTSFPDPPQGYSFLQLVRSDLIDGGARHTLYSMFTKPVSSGVTSIFELVARRSGADNELPIDLSEESIHFVSGSVSGGQAMETLAAHDDHFGNSGNFTRHEITLTCSKITGAPPSSWY